MTGLIRHILWDLAVFTLIGTLWVVAWSGDLQQQCIRGIWPAAPYIHRTPPKPAR